MAMAKNTDTDNTDELSSLMDKITISSDCVGSSLWIDVTHINNPNSFYVRPTSYDKYLAALEARSCKLEANELFPGDIIIFKSRVHKAYIRGQVIYIDNQNDDIKLDLFAMDYGNIEKDIKKIYKPLNINSIPSLVKHCQLELCKPFGGIWEEKSIDAMKFYIGNERTKIIIQDKSNDLLTVTMYNSCPEDISTMLALQGYSTFGYEPNSVNRFSATPAPQKAYYMFQEHKVDDTFQVRVQSGTCLKQFYVAEVNSYKKYLEQRENIAFFAKQANVISPENIYEGKPVCVPTIKRYSYERGIIKKVNHSGSKALVQLVDWGETLEVPFEKIKPIRESFLTIAPVAIYCTADESQAWDNGLQKFLYPGYSFIIEIKSVGESLKTPNMVNIFEIGKSKKVR